EEPRHLAGKLGIKRLINGRKNTFCKQASDQVLRTDFQLLREILNADSFGNRDIARDRQRLIGEREPRRWNKALHRAFFHTARNISLTGTARRSARTAARARRPWRRKAWSDSNWARSCGTLPRRMHGASLTRTQRQSCTRSETRALKDWLTRNRSSRRGTRCNWHAGSWRSTRRCFVDRTWSGLRNDH